MVSKQLLSLFGEQSLASVPRNDVQSRFARNAPVQEAPAQDDVQVPEQEAGAEDYSIMERVDGRPLMQNAPEDASDDNSSQDSVEEAAEANPAEERIREGARRAGQVDMTPAEYEKYSRLRGGDLLDPGSLQNLEASRKRRYYKPERFEGQMESGEGSSLVGLGELNAHVRNRTRMFKPEDGGPSIFEQRLNSARQARARLAQPLKEGHIFDEQRDQAERSQAESLNWLGNSNADPGAAGPGFRAAGSAERPYFTELIPQQYTYSRADKEDPSRAVGPSLPVGPIRELQAQEKAHDTLTRQRDAESKGLSDAFDSDRAPLETRLGQAQAASDEARGRKIGTWNPFKAIARAFTRMRDRRRTSRELRDAQRALAGRTRQNDEDLQQITQRRQGEDADIALKGQPLLNRRQALLQPGVGQQPGAGNVTDLSGDIPETASAKDDTAAPEMRRNVVDPFADAVQEAYSKGKAGRKEAKSKGGEGSVDNYAQALLKLPEPDKDPRYLGIQEAQRRGGDAYQGAVQAHAQRRLLGDIANEDEISGFKYSYAKERLRGVGQQYGMLQSELAKRAEARPEPQTDEDRAAAARFTGFQQQLSEKMHAYTSDRVDKFRPIAEAEKERKAQRKRAAADMQRMREQMQAEWKIDTSMSASRPGYLPDEVDEEGVQKLSIPELDERDVKRRARPGLDDVEEPMIKPEAENKKRKQKGDRGKPGALDEKSSEVLQAQELHDQRARPQTVMPELLGDYMPSSDQVADDMSRKQREEAEAAVKLAPMQGALNDITERSVKFNYDARKEYLRRGDAPGEEFDESQMDVVRPGANPENFQKNYIQGDHFAASKMPEKDPELDPYDAYKQYREIYKKNKKDRAAWEEATGKKVERYELTKDDPLSKFPRPENPRKRLKHGYRLVDR